MKSGMKKMNIKSQLYQYSSQSSSLACVVIEFIIISVIIFHFTNFLGGVVCFLTLLFLFSIPIINSVIAFVLVLIWTVIAFLCSFKNLSISTTIGITLLVFVFSMGLHFGAKSLAEC